jgi:hypothetical protein
MQRKSVSRDAGAAQVRLGPATSGLSAAGPSVLGPAASVTGRSRVVWAARVGAPPENGRPWRICVARGTRRGRGCNASPCRATRAQHKFARILLRRTPAAAGSAGPAPGPPRRTRRVRHARARGSGRVPYGPKVAGRAAVGTRARPKPTECGSPPAPNGMLLVRPGRTARPPRLYRSISCAAPYRDGTPSCCSPLSVGGHVILSAGRPRSPPAHEADPHQAGVDPRL